MIPFEQINTDDLYEIKLYKNRADYMAMLKNLLRSAMDNEETRGDIGEIMDLTEELSAMGMKTEVIAHSLRVAILMARGNFERNIGDLIAALFHDLPSTDSVWQEKKKCWTADETLYRQKYEEVIFAVEESYNVSQFIRHDMDITRNSGDLNYYSQEFNRLLSYDDGRVFCPLFIILVSEFDYLCAIIKLRDQKQNPEFDWDYIEHSINKIIYQFLNRFDSHLLRNTIRDECFEIEEYIKEQKTPGYLNRYKYLKKCFEERKYNQAVLRTLNKLEYYLKENYGDVSMTVYFPSLCNVSTSMTRRNIPIKDFQQDCYYYNVFLTKNVCEKDDEKTIITDILQNCTFLRFYDVDVRRAFYFRDEYGSVLRIRVITQDEMRKYIHGNRNVNIGQSSGYSERIHVEAIVDGKKCSCSAYSGGTVYDFVAEVYPDRLIYLESAKYGDGKEMPLYNYVENHCLIELHFSKTVTASLDWLKYCKRNALMILVDYFQKRYS